MNKEFKKIAGKKETRYVLESASAGATSTASVATEPTGKKDNLLVQGKDDKPVVQRRNPVAANVNATVGGGGAGAHKDKTKTIPRKEKHKKDWRKEFEEGVAEGWGMGGYATATKGATIPKHVPEDSKAEIQAKLQADLDDFIKRGGKITKLPPNKVRVKPGTGLASKHIGSHGELNKGRKPKSLGKARNVGGDKPVVGDMRESNVDSNYIDQENDMTTSDLKSLYKQAVKLRNLIQKMGNSTTLEPWQQAKIAKAADYVNAVFKNLDNEYGLDKVEEKIKGSDGKACWKGYRYAGTKNGKDSCVKVGEEQVNESDYDLNYEIDNPDYNEDDPNSPEMINIGVNYNVFGEYRDATWYDPPEGPELEILKIVNADTGEEIVDPEIIKKIEQYVEDDVLNAEPDFDPPDYDDDDYFRESNENKKGLWANIHARKKKGLPSRKPGEKGAPSKKSWDTAVAASKKKKAVGEDNLEEYETHTYTDIQGRKWRIDDEGNKELIYDPTDRFSKKSYSTSKQPDVYYFYNVPNGSAMKAFDLGLKRTKSGKWYSSSPNANAEKEFGKARAWRPKTEESMMPTSHFAGTPKNKLGPAAHLKGKMKRPAQQGDLVGGSAEESYSKKKT